MCGTVQFLQGILISSYKHAKYYAIQGLVACGLLVFLFLLFVSMLTYPLYGLVIILTRLLPKYGKVCGYLDPWIAEDFTRNAPKSCVVITLVFNGDITLVTLQDVFSKNVLEAKCPSNANKLRYPELKQYLTTFLGFKVWRDDDQFGIQQHIVERDYKQWSQNGDILERIHGDFINRTFPKSRSPWELILMRHVPEKLLDINHSTDGDPHKTLVVLRMHHVLADAKSTLKMLVECLGGKELKTATPKEIPRSWNMFHPWKVRDYWTNRHPRLSVTFSPAFKVSDVKAAAVKFNVTSSSVILNMIAGAIQKTNVHATPRKLGCGYIMPKSNHPETFVNHMYPCVLNLPTDEEDGVRRLQQCNEEFLKIKTGQQGRFLEVITFFGGSTLFPWTGLAVNHTMPCGITNIAGEKEGFSVGGKECVDFRMSVGTLGGACGAVFCVLSYQDTFRVAVIGEENHLDWGSARSLAAEIGKENEIFEGTWQIV